MGAKFFDDLDQPAQSSITDKPFWALDFKDEDLLLAWCNATVDLLVEQAQERHDEQKKNLATYRGIQYRGDGGKTRDEQATDVNASKRSRNPRVIYNHTVDLVEHDVARITKYRGAIAATAPSDDNEDRITASVAENVIEGLWNKVEIDQFLQKHRRRVRIFGEDFIGVFWNQNAGPYDPDWLSEVFKEKGIKADPRKMKRSEMRKVMRKIGEFPRLKLLDPETGKQMTGVDGKELWIDRPMRRGDVAYRSILSWDMFLQRPYGGDYELAEFGCFRERVKVDTIKAMHPSKAHKIEGGGTRYFDVDKFEEIERPGEMEVWHLYHKSTDELDQGRYVKFVRSAVLKNGPNPYSGWDDRKILPWIRTVDIDTPACLNGDATVTHIRGPQAVVNNIISLRIRNRFLFSHPKWFYPANSVTKESLANQSTMVSYKGAVPPMLSQPALAEGNESEMMEKAEDVMQKIGGVYGASRGTPPAGVTAAVALTMLDEQENERANPGIQSHTAAVKNLALQATWIIADNYDDDRIESLVGKNKAAQLGEFKMSNLHDIGDLRISSSTALPQQKSARTQFIIDMRKEAPTVMTDERMVDFLELADDKRMRSVATVAVRKAEAENGAMMLGSPADAPEEHEFHLQHYRIHLSQMNEASYRKLPKADQEAFRDHVRAHEMFLWAQTMKSPGFAQLVMQEFPGFPLFFEPETMDMQPSPTPPGAAGMLPPAPGGEMPPPQSLDPGLPPGAEAMTPPPEAMEPGAESMIPGGAPA